jgi:hypothetical protein
MSKSSGLAWTGGGFITPEPQSQSASIFGGVTAYFTHEAASAVPNCDHDWADVTLRNGDIVGWICTECREAAVNEKWVNSA